MSQREQPKIKGKNPSLVIFDEAEKHIYESAELHQVITEKQTPKLTLEQRLRLARAH